MKETGVGWGGEGRGRGKERGFGGRCWMMVR